MDQIRFAAWRSFLLLAGTLIIFGALGILSP
jgi:hypothetical protein